MPHVSIRLDHDQAAVMQNLEAGKENVVTVFGFSSNRATEEMILQEFGKCGDILRYHCSNLCNWMHIQYGVSWEQALCF